MSRGRFAVLMVLLAMLVATGSFLLALSALSEDSGQARSAAPGEGSAPGTGGDGPTSPAPVASEALQTPAWVAIVSSDADRSAAEGVAEQVRATGRASSVLHSNDHGSLAPGFWVAYVGPFDGRDAADAEVAALGEEGFPGAYARCVGTDQECGG